MCRSSDTYIEKDSSVNEHIEQMRLSATKALLERRDTIIVATVSSIYGLGDPAAYLQMVLHLKRGDTLDQRALLRRLAEMQYTRNDVDFTQGCYRVRGDVIDIFPAESDRDAIRVELFDETIEQLSRFDPLTGEVRAKIPRYTVYPGTHFVTPRDRLVNAQDLIRDELRLRLQDLYDNSKLVEAQRLQQRTTFDLEMIREIGYCQGIENYSRYLSGRQPGEPPPCLYDYLPADALLIVDESHQTIPQLGAMYKGRSLAQGDAGRVRFPPAFRARQPAVEVRGVGVDRAADDLRVGDAGQVRSAQSRAAGRAGGASDRAYRSAGRDPSGAHAGR